MGLLTIGAFTRAARLSPLMDEAETAVGIRYAARSVSRLVRPRHEDIA